MSKIKQLLPEYDAGLDECQCEEILPPDYQEWLDSLEPTIEEKEAALKELTSDEPVF